MDATRAPAPGPTGVVEMELVGSRPAVVRIADDWREALGPAGLAVEIVGAWGRSLTTRPGTPDAEEDHDPVASTETDGASDTGKAAGTGEVAGTDSATHADALSGTDAAADADVAPTLEMIAAVPARIPVTELVELMAAALAERSEYAGAALEAEVGHVQGLDPAGHVTVSLGAGSLTDVTLDPTWVETASVEEIAGAVLLAAGAAYTAFDAARDAVRERFPATRRLRELTDRALAGLDVAA